MSATPKPPATSRQPSRTGPESAGDIGQGAATGGPRLNTRGLARRALILKAATDLFLERGYDAVSLDEIIREVGGSKTNIYNMFGGKEGLFVAIFQGLGAEFVSPLRQLELGDTPPEIALGILGRTLMRQLVAPRHLAFQRMVLAASGRFPELLREWYRAGPRASRRVIAQVLRDLPDPERRAILFHDMIATDAIMRGLMDHPAPWPEIEARIDLAVRVTCEPPQPERAS